MNRRQEKHTSKGITLIALVITIIVMLILVAVTIQIAVNGGLFEYAGKASGDTKNAIDEENSLATGRVEVDGKVYESIDDYIAGKEDIPFYDKADKNNDGTLKSNAKYESDGKIAIIPKGFKIIEDAEGKKSIDEGLVIQDSEGNEFVWIPVAVEGSTDAEKEANFEKIRKDGYESGSLQTDVSGKKIAEPFENGYTDGKGTEETKDYQEMRTSVIKNGGFYIGRYEAGVEGDTPRTNKANGTNKMVVQRDKIPYTYVGWGSSISNYDDDITYNGENQGKGALYLSKHMYDGKDIGATSTLCYGIQWDATLAFIGDESYNKDSTSKGNHMNSTWTITRETAKSSSDNGATWKAISEEINKTKAKTASESILLTTGASEDFRIKNIYDLAGNVFERTNDVYFAADRVYRGGVYGLNGNLYPVSSRYSFYSNYCSYEVGFRSVLYIK